MLVLKRMTREDIFKVMEWRTLPEVSNYMYTDPKLTKEDQIKWFERVSASDKYIYWMIEFDGNQIGVINLYDIDKDNQRCFWAYYIADTSFRGKGIGRNLECNMYDYVFDHLNFNKLCCEVFVDNEKVIQIHQKFGSKVEGTFKEHILKAGKFKDIVRMGILRSEWQAIKGNYEYEIIEIE